MKTIELDLRCIDTVRAMHIYLQYMLDLPAHYGRNLDALYDLLSEPGEALRLRVLAAGNASQDMASCLPRLARVLRDAAEANEGLHIEWN